MDKIENKIVSYFLEEFGKNNLTAIRIKPIQVKYPDKLDFINNHLRHRVLKSINQYEFIPHFETIVKVNSAYKTELVKDIEIVYLYFKKLHSNPDVDEVRATLSDVYSNINLNKQRALECLYYLTESSGFLSYSVDIKNGKVVFGETKNFFMLDDFLRYKTYGEYLEQVTEWWSKHDDEWLSGINQNNQIETKNKTSNSPTKQDRECCIKTAKELWKQDPAIKISTMVQKKELQIECSAKQYNDRTV